MAIMRQNETAELNHYKLTYCLSVPPPSLHGIIIPLLEPFKGKNSGKLGAKLLCPIVEQKLPQKIRARWSQKKKGGNLEGLFMREREKFLGAKGREGIN